MKPKIQVFKKQLASDEVHWRYYLGGQYALDPQNTRRKSDGKPYPLILVDGQPIISEKQLVIFMVNTFGYGQFRVIANAYRRRGFWTFWEGIANEQGWEMFQKNYDKKEMNKYKRDLWEAERDGDSEEAESLRNQIQWEKEQARTETKKKRYGFYPFLKRSGTRGVFHSWDEPDLAFLPDYGPESRKDEYEE